MANKNTKAARVAWRKQVLIPMHKNGQKMGANPPRKSGPHSYAQLTKSGNRG